MKSYFAPTKIMMGDTLKAVLNPYSRVFLVTDTFMVDSGKTAYVVERLGQGAVYEVFADVEPDPDIDTVAKGTERLLSFKPDVVVALGGGSPIDAAKAVIFFAAQTTEDKKMLPFIAVPTTSGTGSEMSRFSVITDRKNMIKYPIIDDMLLPTVAVLDAELVKTAPPQITADTGLDVLTHAIEAFVSTVSTDFSDAAAEKAIKLVWQHLLNAYSYPDNLDARQGMHNASTLAGIAFSNSGLGLVHGMAHAVGARFHLPHGKTNGIILPYVMTFNAGCIDSLTPIAKEYAEISRLLSLSSTSTRQSALNLIRHTQRLIKKLSIPASLSEAGIPPVDFEEALPSMVEAALADSCTATNPRECTTENVTQVFRQAYYGKSHLYSFNIPSDR